MESDPFDLERFVTAQHGVFDGALAELQAGRKRSHWMWFVFPQLSGLGTSAMARRFAIGSLDEARAYLDHPQLGPRLRAATDAVNAHSELTAQAILGSPDDLKFRSAMTLFAAAASDATPFATALQTFYGGEPDALTLVRLSELGRNEPAGRVAN